ncbi:TPA: hypothetical protein RQJ36_004185 [Vibrio vulnificus]|nr:hypothetical protein [Vibrio vulnificus]
MKDVILPLVLAASLSACDADTMKELTEPALLPTAHAAELPQTPIAYALAMCEQYTDGQNSREAGICEGAAQLAAELSTDCQYPAQEPWHAGSMVRDQLDVIVYFEELGQVERLPDSAMREPVSLIGWAYRQAAKCPEI